MDDYFKDWERYKKEALETGDFEIYKTFLFESQKMFINLLAKFTHKDWIKLVEDILKKIAQESKWVRLKEKEAKLPF